MLNLINMTKYFLILVMVLSLCMSCDPGGSVVSRYEVPMAKVSDKTTKRYKDNDKYLIFTDKGEFEVTDSLIHTQFRSSEIYGRVKVGECYNLTVYGYRSGILSSYPTVVEAKLIDCE